MIAFRPRCRRRPARQGPGRARPRGCPGAGAPGAQPQPAEGGAPGVPPARVWPAAGLWRPTTWLSLRLSAAKLWGAASCRTGYKKLLDACGGYPGYDPYAPPAQVVVRSRLQMPGRRHRRLVILHPAAIHHLPTAGLSVSSCLRLRLPGLPGLSTELPSAATALSGEPDATARIVQHSAPKRDLAPLACTGKRRAEGSRV